MSNEALKTYLTGYLRDLGRKQGGGRFIYDDLAEATELSTSTIFSWLRGGPASPQKVEQLANGLLALARAAENAPKLRNVTREEIIEKVSEALARARQLPPFRLFRYPPISGLPSNAPEEWSFLGDLMRNFLLASNLDEQEDLSLSLQEADVADLNMENNPDVLAGCFATPDRMAEWAFIRTPINIPLTAVVVERDVAAVLRHRPSSRGPRTVKDYLKGLSSALWRHYGTTPSQLPRIRGELLPITAREEVGRKHLRHVHQFTPAELDLGATSNASAGAFLERLLKASEALQKAGAGDSAGLESVRLPLAILDELTALKVLKAFDGTDVAKVTAARLLAEPADELAELAQVHRPRFSVTLAIRRDQPAATSTSRYSFEATQRAFEEFLFVHASVVTHQYVRLFSALLDQYGEILGELAPLQFLKWLSIEVCPADVGVEEPAEAGVLPSALSANPQLWAWQDILRSAKAIIVHDPRFRGRLRRALEKRKELLDGERASGRMVGFEA